MNIIFSIFGFDFVPSEKVYGLHFLSFKATDDTKSLLGIHYWEGEWILSICFFNIFIYPSFLS